MSKITEAASATDTIQDHVDVALSRLQQGFNGRIVNGYGRHLFRPLHAPQRPRGGAEGDRGGARRHAGNGLADQCGIRRRRGSSQRQRQLVLTKRFGLAAAFMSLRRK